MKKIIALQGLLLLAFWASLPAAQCQSALQTGAEKNPEIIVTATRSEQQLVAVLPATTLITRAEIEQSQALDLVTLLRQVAGLEISQSGGMGTQASVFMRGANSNQTLVLIDGVPLNNLNFGSAALEHMALADVDRIEIVRGNVSSLYGSRAIGGVIQVFTNESSRSHATQARATVRYGSRNFTSVSSAGSAVLASGMRLSASAEQVSDKGINAIDQSKIPFTNPDRDGYRRSGYAIGARQDFGVGNSVSWTTRATNSNTQYDSQWGPATQADASSFHSDATSLSLQIQAASGLKLKSVISNSNDNLQADVTAYPYYVRSNNQMMLFGAQWRWAPEHTLTAGVERVRQHISSDTNYTQTSRIQSSVRLGYEGAVGAHQFQGNLRQDDYSDFGRAYTYLIGYGYHFHENWRVNASNSTGFNAPTFNDLYYPTSGNPNLKPERVVSNELGLQHFTATSESRIVWFNHRYADLIALNSNWSSININAARTDGIELSTRQTFHATSVSAGLTFQSVRNLGNNQQLDLRAGRVAFIRLQQGLGAWQIGANLRYSGSRLDRSGAQTLGPYALLDLNSSYAINKNLKFLIRIENVTNRDYETAYGYNQPGRSLFTGISWQLK